MAAETEKGSGKLSGRALAKGRENGGHLSVANSSDGLIFGKRRAKDGRFF